MVSYFPSICQWTEIIPRTQSLIWNHQACKIKNFYCGYTPFQASRWKNCDNRSDNSQFCYQINYNIDSCVWIIFCVFLEFCFQFFRLKLEIQMKYLFLIVLVFNYHFLLLAVFNIWVWVEIFTKSVMYLKKFDVSSEIAIQGPD